MFDLMNGHLIVGAANISMEVVSSDPSPGTDGQIIVNSTSDEIKIWYNNVWNTIGITITPGVAVTPVTGNPFGAWLGIWRTYTI